MFSAETFANMMDGPWYVGVDLEKFLASLLVPGGLVEGNYATPESMLTFQMEYMAVPRKGLILSCCKLAPEFKSLYAAMFLSAH